MELLRSIRRGDFQKEDKTFSQDFYDMISEYEIQLEKATKHTSLLDNPNMEKVMLNRRICRYNNHDML